MYIYRPSRATFTIKSFTQFSHTAKVTIGDSWAAGAAVKSQGMYDDNSACLRNKAAWEVQMAGDDSWTDSAVDFKFLACSGAQLVAAVKGDNENKQPTPQLDGAGTPRLLTMELGVIIAISQI